jgi:hypothetical protein
MIDHAEVLKEIRDYLRKNDDNGFVLSSLKFLLFPLDGKNSNDIVYAEEFASLVFSRKEKFKDHLLIYDKSVLWLQNLIDNSTTGKVRQIGVDLADKLAAVWDGLYTCTISEKKVSVLLPSKNRVEDRQLRITLSPYDTYLEDNSDRNWEKSKLDYFRIFYPTVFQCVIDVNLNRKSVDYKISYKLESERDNFLTDPSQMYIIQIEPDWYHRKTDLTYLDRTIEWSADSQITLIVDYWKGFLTSWETQRQKNIKIAQKCINHARDTFIKK